MSLSRESKLQDIKNFIQNDLLASDLKLSLFISASKCYKKDFLVNPFPAFYIKNDIKDFDKLVWKLIKLIVHIIKNSFVGWWSGPDSSLRRAVVAFDCRIRKWTTFKWYCDWLTALGINWVFKVWCTDCPQIKAWWNIDVI